MQKLLLFVFLPISLFAQVSNDNIESRILLEIGKTYSSRTDSCTLQNNCLNTEITGKCIKYHNDQWFEFTATESKPYFINIKNQNCRDVLGVQLVVIDGIPCAPETYKSLECVSLSNQDDVYVKLDSLNINQSYLLVVDGYLHDYCKFEIELSDKPIGLPLKQEPKREEFSKKIKGKVLELKWTSLPEMCSDYEFYTVFRRNEKNRLSTIVDKIEHQKDAYGEHELSYSSLDTLPEKGKYVYQIIANKGNGEKDLIETFSIKFDDTPERKFSNHNLTISKTFKKNTPIEVIIQDAISQQVLIREERQPTRDHQMFYDIGEYVENGSFMIKVTIKNLKKGKKQYYTIDWRKYLIQE